MIEITDSLALSGTISVSGKKVSIVAAAPGITIRREQKEDGTVFNGTMFTVAGQGSELQFSVKDGSDLTVDGSNGKGEEELPREAWQMSAIPALSAFQQVSL